MQALNGARHCGVPQDLHLNGPFSFQIRVARAARRMASMDGLLPHVQISGLSRRRLARWLIGSPIRVVERDLILETLAHTHGNRTLAARLLGVSVRTLRNRIAQYSAEARTTTNEPVTAPPSTLGTAFSPRNG